MTQKHQNAPYMFPGNRDQRVWGIHHQSLSNNVSWRDLRWSSKLLRPVSWTQTRLYRIIRWSISSCRMWARLDRTVHLRRCWLRAAPSSRVEATKRGVRGQQRIVTSTYVVPGSNLAWDLDGVSEVAFGQGIRGPNAVYKRVLLNLLRISFVLWKNTINTLNHGVPVSPLNVEQSVVGHLAM